MKNIYTILARFYPYILWLLFGVTTSGNLSAQPFKLKATNDLQRVFQDGYNLPESSDTIKLFGIRNEIISGQCYIQTIRQIEEVYLKADGLTHIETGTSIPSDNVQCHFVGSVPLTKNAPNQPAGAVVRSAPASFPDYLMSEEKLEKVGSNYYQSIYLTLMIPPHARSGIYKGQVEVGSDKGKQTLPLILEVFPLSLPEERHLKVAIWYSTGRFKEYHGIDENYSTEWFEMLKKYAQNMAAHRENVFRVPMGAIEIKRTGEKEFVFDFTRFDQIANVFWETEGMDYIETGFLTKFDDGWSGDKISFKDISVYDVELGKETRLPGKQVLPFLLPAFENHLRSRDWLDKTFFHIKDEPSLNNALSWREASKYVHQLAPDILRLDAIETTYLGDNIEVEVPKLDHLADWYQTYKENARKYDIELWFYTVGIYQGAWYPNKTIDMPLMDNRLLHWLNYKYDIPGYLHWGFNQWSGSPYQEVGKHVGDAWHVYPEEDGILNSLRWEQLRNGIQDYEYFWLLENKVKILKDSLGYHFEWIDPTQPGKEIASKVVKDFVQNTDDPAVLYDAKRELIREIMNFESSPKIYVQTNPSAGSAMTGRAFVEVYGWTEPGTEITINGKEVGVKENGLFLKLSSLTGVNGNEIIIKARGKDDSKEIIKKFKIVEFNNVNNN